jgi:hypothetical protein
MPLDTMGPPIGTVCPSRHALGRSRGGWGTKLHLVCDRRGFVLAFRNTAGQVDECTVFTALLGDIAVPGVRGGVRRRPEAVAGDKG